MIPQFAVIGHPNEGKSSVLSTLAEDDSVVISPLPGETRKCRTFPITIDGRPMVQLVDTPGFQNPRKILASLKKKSASGLDAFKELTQNEASDPDLADDCELLRPVLTGAAIIYVVDGSRPLRTVDKIEMEILRLTGRPRMAVLNNKEEEQQYLNGWKEELRKNFNSIRLFNAHQATYVERINLLQALKSIDQDLEPLFDSIIQSFEIDWQNRNSQVASKIIELLKQALPYTVSSSIKTEDNRKQIEQKLYEQYKKQVSKLEEQTLKAIRKLYKHNIFNIELPENSILHDDLFSEKTWQVLGLNKKQMMIAGGIGGATLGATADIVAHGLSFGLFTALGTVLGSTGALLGGKKFSQGHKLLGIPLGKEEVIVGPNKNHSFPFILLDRSLLYYNHVINWAHGRRSHQATTTEISLQNDKMQGFSTLLDKKEMRLCTEFFNVARENKTDSSSAEKEQLFFHFLTGKLQNISTGKQV